MLTYVKAHDIWYRSQADVPGQIWLGVLSFIVPQLAVPGSPLGTHRHRVVTSAMAGGAVAGGQGQAGSGPVHTRLLCGHSGCWTLLKHKSEQRKACPELQPFPTSPAASSALCLCRLSSLLSPVLLLLPSLLVHPLVTL